jgi:peptidoglycan glycosyltransferase
MVLAVERGTAREAALPGIPTAGKTGTAQTGAGQDHSWFVGFAPAYDPEVAVVVVLEHGGIASQTAAPLGGAVLQAALAACTPQGM